MAAQRQYLPNVAAAQRGAAAPSVPGAIAGKPSVAPRLDAPSLNLMPDLSLGTRPAGSNGVHDSASGSNGDSAAGNGLRPTSVASGVGPSGPGKSSRRSGDEDGSNAAPAGGWSEGDVDSIAAASSLSRILVPDHPSGIVPTLQNIVTTVNLGCKLELKTIAIQARNAEYNPKRFSAVIMRIRDPKTTALVFATGKMVCTGAKNIEASKQAARMYALSIKKIGFPVKFTQFAVQNVVASCDVKFPIRLESLAHEHTGLCRYEPELFPGLIYSLKTPKTVLLIFVSGRVVITGGKSEDDIKLAFHQIYPVLCQHRKT